MGAKRIPNEGSSPGRDEVLSNFSAEGLSPHMWGNSPGETYSWHSHTYHKVLYCVTGSIVFHTKEGHYELLPGDRLEIDSGTDHSATVGPHGVECAEAAR
jgi:quercetin dioxygenase-like cupin family protein